MKIEKFEDIVAWQKAKKLALEIYRLFEKQRDFGFRDQIQSAVVSIMNNIAEGFERGSHKELVRFLYIAKGSSGEVRSMLSLAIDLKYISQEDFEKNYAAAAEISRMLYGLINKVKR